MKGVIAMLATILILGACSAAFAAGCGDTSRSKAGCYCPRGGCTR
jgi:hypothetical protein